MVAVNSIYQTLNADICTVHCSLSEVGFTVQCSLKKEINMKENFDGLHLLLHGLNGHMSADFFITIITALFQSVEI